eukprot:364374-Chlamydomonas_euryale.AAC.13
MLCPDTLPHIKRRQLLAAHRAFRLDLHPSCQALGMKEVPAGDWATHAHGRWSVAWMPCSAMLCSNVKVQRSAQAAQRTTARYRAVQCGTV